MLLDLAFGHILSCGIEPPLMGLEEGDLLVRLAVCVLRLYTICHLNDRSQPQ